MKILIIRLSSLGDIVLTQPICRCLREQYPDAIIDYLCKTQYSELVSLMGCGLNPIAYKKNIAHHLMLRSQQYDLVLDLQNKFSSFLLRTFAAAKNTRVYDKQRALRKRIVAHTTDQAISHTLDLYKSALRGIADNPQLDPPSLQVPELSLPIAIPEAAKVIMLFPGAAHYTKMYPAASYKDLLQSSPEDYFFILAGSRTEYSLCEELHRASPSKSMNLAGKLSFPEILKAMQGVDWVISSDSGPMHLAAALQKPQIAIFGATHPRLGFAPLNPHAAILCRDLPCQPCSLHGGDSCPQKHFKCMLQITPQSIIDILTSDITF